MNIYEPEKPSQKSLNNSQKSLIDDYKKLKKEVEELTEYLTIICNIIDPKQEKYLDDCIKDLQILIKQNKTLLKHYEKTKKFIEQQKTGRTKINLDENKIKYLRDIKKMTFEEIAKKYNVSRNTIRNRYYNNRQ